MSRRLAQVAPKESIREILKIVRSSINPPWVYRNTSPVSRRRHLVIKPIDSFIWEERLILASQLRGPLAKILEGIPSDS